GPWGSIRFARFLYPSGKGGSKLRAPGSWSLDRLHVFGDRVDVHLLDRDLRRVDDLVGGPNEGRLAFLRDADDAVEEVVHGLVDSARVRRDRLGGLRVMRAVGMVVHALCRVPDHEAR